MNADVRTILAGELHQLASDLTSQASGLSEGSEDAAVHCLGLCERLGQVATMIDVPALQEVAVFLMTNIPALLGNVTATQAPAELCADLELCLLEGAESSRWQGLAARLADERWPAALDSIAANEITQNLKPLSIPIEYESPVPPQLTRDALTLSPPPDVGETTLRAFIHEAPQQAGKLSRMLGEYRAAPSPQTLVAALRIIHTLKGSSALCGLHAIVHLSHALESRLQLLVDAEAPPPKNTLERVLSAGDAIEQLIECVTDNVQPPVELLDATLQLINALYATEPEESSEWVDFSAERGSESAELTQVAVNQPANVPEPIVESPIVDSNGEPDSTLNVSVALIDENLRRASELNIGIGQLTAQTTQTLERVNRLTQQLERVQTQVYELETLVDTRGVPSARIVSSQFGAGGNGVARSDFDPLELDEYTALHSLSRAFSETALDSRELTRELSEDLLNLQNSLAQHARLGRELNDSVMNARLVPVATIVPRLERIVRQTSRQLQREVQLTIAGRDLQIDTDILNGLVEPLMHALRNAVDHGLESETERRTLGKSPAGNIELRFKREGNRIEVCIADDGRGLDYAAIERRGRELGLLSVKQAPSERELSALIFHPGFSTRSEVSSISGRGVGMDVVRASVERLKGRVHIESSAGQSCVLTFILPLSLTSAHALFVAVGDAVYGLPSTSVEQVLYSDAGEVRQLGEKFAFEYNGQISPLYALSALLGEQSGFPENFPSQPRPLVIVRDDTGLSAVVVDRALDSRQIVIKGLSRMLPALPGVAGACVLPNGGIGVVLEIRELLRRSPTEQQHSAAIETPAPVAASRVALIVDDSLSARRTLAQLLSDAGYQVETAIDGLDALARMEKATPHLLLVDLEMPRMNGLELTSHLRSKSQWSAIPIIMITSRAAEKHRAQALRAGVTEYLTKPYVEHELLDRLYALAPP